MMARNGHWTAEHSYPVMPSPPRHALIPGPHPCRRGEASCSFLGHALVHFVAPIRHKLHASLCSYWRADWPRPVFRTPSPLAVPAVAAHYFHLRLTPPTRQRSTSPPI